ncbi:helix-turn-helix transcriptional regulator [Paenibacillus contaminans]|uniref:ArsR family transcriptional regulator n=1 Tax=Paenibacillus contaminans TaxID=450362 RepID=A0A329MH56_9BACL|nr:metalloregulator ArsR/SmtB family transcription factor [Paenibacillus contaminans]RAV18948.1 ArsR family transcriptional regulator [Paenibacillus contaminans]
MNNDHESSTRKVLLNMMKTRGALSVGEMAKELRITEMAVRRHLNTLERDGLIETKLSRQAMGRPTHLYSLTMLADDLFPKNYHHLTLDLLGELEAEEGSDMIGRLFERRKEKLFAKYGERMEGKALPERVTELADIQNKNGYMVQLERQDEGEFVLTEYNCPIAQVAGQYNEACQCELTLFEKLLDADVERTECLTKGGAKCTYVIRKANQKTSP